MTEFLECQECFYGYMYSLGMEQEGSPPTGSILSKFTGNTSIMLTSLAHEMCGRPCLKSGTFTSKPVRRHRTHSDHDGRSIRHGGGHEIDTEEIKDVNDIVVNFCSLTRSRRVADA